jgi:hypothetical protein
LVFWSHHIDTDTTLTELQTIIQIVESVQARLAEIKKKSSTAPRKADLLDDAEASLIWAMNKLMQLRIIAKAEVREK